MLLCYLTLSSSPTCLKWSAIVEELPTFKPSFHPPSLLPDMTLDDVRDYERQMHEKTNIKVWDEQQEQSANPSSVDGIEIHDRESVCVFSLFLSINHSSVSYFGLLVAFETVPYIFTHFLPHRVKLSVHEQLKYNKHYKGQESFQYCIYHVCFSVCLLF